MQKSYYLKGIKAGKIARTLIGIFLSFRRKMLIKAGKSKLRKIIASMTFIAMIIVLIGVMSTTLYLIFGIIGPVIFLLFSAALPKASSSLKDDSHENYSFNDGYRDGPEGYGYYSGGYRVDD